MAGEPENVVWVLWRFPTSSSERELLGVFDTAEKAKEAAQEHSRLRNKLQWLEYIDFEAFYANHPEPFNYSIVKLHINQLSDFP